MYKISVEKEGAILYIEFGGHITDEEALKAEKEFKFNVKKIKEGALVICEISGLQSGSRFARLILQHGMRMLNERNPGVVIRVIENYFGAVFFDRAYSVVNPQYEVYKTSSKNESELNKLRVGNINF